MLAVQDAASNSGRVSKVKHGAPWFVTKLSSRLQAVRRGPFATTKAPPTVFMQCGSDLLLKFSSQHYSIQIQ
jgi:hypothetical protein